MDTKSRRIKFQPIVDELKERIERGALSPGERLPSFAEMQATYGLGSNTVNRVFIELEQQGLVERRQGSGVYVAEVKPVRTATIAIGFGTNNSEGAHYWFHLLRGVQRAAERYGLRNLLPVSMNDLPMENMDGILLHGGKAPWAYPELLPAVIMMQATDGMPSVVADDGQGIELAVRHLAELGHRRIGYLAWLDHDAMQLRRRAFSLALARNSMEITGLERCMKYYPDSMPSQFLDGHLNMRHWLEEGFLETGCTALLVHNDQNAIGAIRALQDIGLRVPEDISVVGFDGAEDAQQTRPTLTTVKVPLELIAETAVDLLARLMGGQEVSAEPVVLPVELIVGQSTAPARRAG